MISRFSKHFPLPCSSSVILPELMNISPFLLAVSYILMQFVDLRRRRRFHKVACYFIVFRKNVYCNLSVIIEGHRGLSSIGNLIEQALGQST